MPVLPTRCVCIYIYTCVYSWIEHRTGITFTAVPRRGLCHLNPRDPFYTAFSFALLVDFAAATFPLIRSNYGQARPAPGWTSSGFHVEMAEPYQNES